MKMPIIKQMPSMTALNFREETRLLLLKYSGDLPADQMLAMASHMVGQILAMQDQRVMTPDMALEIVSLNIEAGNAEMIENVAKTKGSA
jgi:hypothetical protein